MNTTKSNHQIAKNAVALYFRMSISMLVGLYTSRVILRALGIEDYGIYNVVAGFVSLFSLISASLQGSITRFLTFELGKGNSSKLCSIFSTSFMVMAGISFVILSIGETVGLWYLDYKMVIPENRFHAASICFQFSLASFVLSLLSTPYSSIIISYERMGLYAYISIVDAVLKLAICFAVLESPLDKLELYAILMFLVSLIDQIIYWCYCHNHFKECRISLSFDITLLKEMFSFAGWSFIGTSASVLRFQGANLLLNAFGGPVVNAANGIANSVCSIVYSFVANFSQAYNPQITKRYAAKEFESLMNLLIYGAKYSFFLLLFISLPIFINTEYILQLWLGTVPDYSVIFVRLILLYLLIESLSIPLITAKSATGRIRNYQLVVGGVVLLMLPISYYGLDLGLPVEFVAIVNIFVSLVSFFVRLIMLRGDFPKWSSTFFFRKVFFNTFFVGLSAACIPVFIHVYLPHGFHNFLLSSCASFFCSLIAVLMGGCNKIERKFLVYKCHDIVRKILAR